MEKMKDCSICKFCDKDYIFDEETGDEFPLYTCEKGNDTDLDFECKDFEEYKPKPYKEKDTECDKCYKLNDCIKNGYVVKSTYSLDTREHYIKGRGCVCLKGCEEFLEMKLSEILNAADTVEMKKFIEKAIEQLGDMTYREFYQEGKFLEMEL